MTKLSWLRLAVLAVPLGFTAAFAAEPATPAGDAPAKEWADQVKEPCSAFKWGADLRLRHEYHENAFTLDDQADNEYSYNRYRARVWYSIAATDDISFNNRWVWEGRYYWRPESREGFDDSYILSDQLNVVFRKLGGTESSITVGRQDMNMLDGWLVNEGTPLDGSRTMFFDAVRAQVDLKEIKSKLDVSYLVNRSNADDWSPIIMSDDESSLVEQNEQGAIVDFANKSIDGLQLDAFAMYKHADAVLANGDQGDIYTLGGRAEKKFDDNWSARAMGAYQFGQKESILYPDSDGDVSAFGVNSRVSYAFNDTMKNQVNMDFEFLSGDDPDTKNNEAFDILWGRYPRFSDLYLYTQRTETRVGDYTNLYRVGPSWQMQPVQPLLLNFGYNALFADERTYAANTDLYGDGYFRGHLFLASAKYKFSRFMSATLLGEYLAPGNYFSDNRQDNGLFVRAELMFTF